MSEGGSGDVDANLILGAPHMLRACNAMEAYRAHWRGCSRRKTGWLCSACAKLWAEASRLLTEALEVVRGE